MLNRVEGTFSISVINNLRLLVCSPRSYSKPGCEGMAFNSC